MKKPPANPRKTGDPNSYLEEVKGRGSCYHLNNISYYKIYSRYVYNLKRFDVKWCMEWKKQYRKTPDATFRAKAVLAILLMYKQ